ncbi:MAG: hypothetical protein Q7K21_00970 [Elusimicrobiota bacterium]|nr:hypothetical protein [Elusimicrobiota bacterium]
MKKTILAVAGILVLGWAVVHGQTSTETATNFKQESDKIKELVMKSKSTKDEKEKTEIYSMIKNRIPQSKEEIETLLDLADKEKEQEGELNNAITEGALSNVEDPAFGSIFAKRIKG